MEDAVSTTCTPRLGPTRSANYDRLSLSHGWTVSPRSLSHLKTRRFSCKGRLAVRGLLSHDYFGLRYLPHDTFSHIDLRAVQLWVPWYTVSPLPYSRLFLRFQLCLQGSDGITMRPEIPWHVVNETSPALSDCNSFLQ